MIKTISHMPGAAGNFMARLLTQAHSPDQFLSEFAYAPEPPKTLIDGFERYEDWREWERRARPTRYEHTHHATQHYEPWLRITVTTPEEWLWATSNAHHKGSDIRAHEQTGWGEFHRASDPGLPATHHVGLSRLWSWRTLEERLPAIQNTPANPHQHRLWRQWSRTWCPHTDDPGWRAQLDSRWRDLEPRW